MARRVAIKGMKPQAVFGRAVQEFLPKYSQLVEQEIQRGDK
jgi:hypothetical protein